MLISKLQFPRLSRLAKFSTLLNIKINDQSFTFPAGRTIIQACDHLGIEIPRFCYHPRLNIAGNCRMCLVQVHGIPKPVASCAQPISEGMQIYTENDVVKKYREGVMEFLLANHPLDCVVCDQGGECDLQDQAMAYGSDRSRYRSMFYGKRSVEDKEFGPLVKTSMNRCIHCTRCVRFANEVAGVPDLGTTGRGNEMQIGMYLENMFLNSELSGNVVDLCPVGALTSKPLSFQMRPWELKRTPSIDLMDALGSAVRVDSRGPRVMRILPRENEEINEEWLSDKGRYACDGLRFARLLSPWVDGKKVDWLTALDKASEIIKEASHTNVIAGPFTECETMKAASDLFEGASLVSSETGTNLDKYLLRLPVPIAEFETQVDTLILIGCNPRHEAPLLNARIRKAWLRGALKRIYMYSQKQVNLGYDYEWSSELSNLKCEERTVVLIGQNLLLKSPNVLSQVPRGALIGSIPLFASSVGATELNFTQTPKPGALRILMGGAEGPGDIIMGSHGNEHTLDARVVLPVAAPYEAEGLFVNAEGRWQQARASVPPPGNAKPAWQVLRALSEYMQSTLPYESLDALRSTMPFELDVPDTKHVRIPRNSTEEGPIDLSFAIKDYYLTDCLSRASPTMKECSLAFTK